MKKYFKIGDRVKCISEVPNGPKKGQIYIVRSIAYNWIGIKHPHHIPRIASGEDPNWGSTLFEYVNEPPKTELEWLDRVKENFSEGF